MKNSDVIAALTNPPATPKSSLQHTGWRGEVDVGYARAECRTDCLDLLETPNSVDNDEVRVFPGHISSDRFGQPRPPCRAI